MTRIFISHSARNAPAAQRLGELITQFGHDVYDPASVTPGENIVEEILTAIKGSDIVVALPDEQSGSVLFEVGYAFGVGKQVVVVSPFSMELPAPLSNTLCVRVGQVDEEAAFQILAALPSRSAAEGQRVSEARPDLADPKSWERLDPREFEELLAAWFARTGAHVEPAGTTMDRGYDLSITDPKTEKRYIIEIKKYSRSNLVSLEVVRQLLRAVAETEADAGILVTASDFTRSARDFAEHVGVPLLLWRTDDVESWRLP